MNSPGSRWMPAVSSAVRDAGRVPPFAAMAMPLLAAPRATTQSPGMRRLSTTYQPAAT